MFRIFLILSLCALFMACSSNDSEALKEWFSDQDIATSYGKEDMEVAISLKSVSSGYDTAYMVSTFAALGKTNGIEQSLYFGLTVTDTLDTFWKLRTDSAFYSRFEKEQNDIKAEIFWLKEQEFLLDSNWLKFLTPFPLQNKKEITIKREQGDPRDTFIVVLPDELRSAAKPVQGDTTHLLVGIKPVDEDIVLRITPPSASDIRNLLRVAQKTDLLEECEKCLRSGVRESLNVVFEMSDEKKNEIANKTVVFAQLVLPKQNTEESKYPMPIYVYSNGVLEDYRADSTFVFKDDSLALQVTRSLRKNSLEFTLKLGNLILNDTLFSRPAYERYDFNFEGAKLKLWFADYGDGKK
jgi:hypothetical protein